MLNGGQLWCWRVLQYFPFLPIYLMLTFGFTKEFDHTVYKSVNNNLHFLLLFFNIYLNAIER